MTAKETGKKEAGGNETDKKETSGKEIGRKETSRKEIDKKEISRKEIDKKEIKITPIVEGIVIDHIPFGRALEVAKILDVEKYNNPATIGLNLASNKMKLKDCIKIEGRSLSNYELGKIAIIAPNATVSLIHESKVDEKFKVKLPKEVKNTIKCRNPNCITNVQKVETRFDISDIADDSSVSLFRCFFCERVYFRDEVDLL